METYSEERRHALRKAEIHFEMASQHLVWAENPGEDPASHHLDAHLQTVAGLDLFFEVWEWKLRMKVDRRSIMDGVPHVFVVSPGHGYRFPDTSRFSDSVGDKHESIPHLGKSPRMTFPGENTDGPFAGAPPPHYNGVNPPQEYHAHPSRPCSGPIRRRTLQKCALSSDKVPSGRPRRNEDQTVAGEEQADECGGEVTKSQIFEMHSWEESKIQGGGEGLAQGERWAAEKSGVDGGK